VRHFIYIEENLREKTNKNGKMIPVQAVEALRVARG
jgi:hypothetical protein